MDFNGLNRCFCFSKLPAKKVSSKLLITLFIDTTAVVAFHFAYWQLAYE